MGLLKWIFVKLLTNKLTNDPEIIKSANKADEAAENLRCSIRKAEKNGVIVPDAIKKSVGMEIKKEQ